MKNISKRTIIIGESIFIIITILTLFVFINLSVKWIIRYFVFVLYILIGLLTPRFFKTWVLLSPILITLNVRWFINFETFDFPFSGIDILGLLYLISLFYSFKKQKATDEFKKPLFVFLIAIFFSSINCFKPHFTFFTTGFLILGYSYYNLIIDEIETQRELNIFIYLLFFCFLINSIVAIFQYQGGFFIFGEEVSPTYEKGTLFPGGRVKGLFIHPNSFAGIMAIFSPFILSFSLFSPVSKKYKLYFLFTFIMVSISIFFSFSRNGYITYLISCLVLLLLSIYKKKRKIFYYTIGVLLIIVIINILILNLFPNIYQRIFSIFNYKYDPAMRIRFFLWKKSLAEFKQHFITGIGWGNFVFKPYSFGLLIPHNLYINILLELGVLGAIAFIYFIYTLFKRLFKMFYYCETEKLYLVLPVISAWIGFFINNIVDSIFTSPTHMVENKFFWILLGLTTLSHRFLSKDNF